METDLIWAFDTTGPWVATAAHDGRQVCRASREDVRLQHNEVLCRHASELLGTCGGSRPRTIAVCVGPGSFTGTRVGTAFSLGLAEAVGADLVPVTSFEVAASLAPPGCARVAVALPVVQDAWCRATLVRSGTAWREETLEELPVDRIGAVDPDVPLIVPWGDAVGTLQPPADWQPAIAVLSAAAGRPGVRPTRVRIRYVGPSQAERKFRERRHRS